MLCPRGSGLGVDPNPEECSPQWFNPILRAEGDIDCRPTEAATQSDAITPEQRSSAPPHIAHPHVRLGGIEKQCPTFQHRPLGR
jgi:hypothetical protein